MAPKRKTADGSKSTAKQANPPSERGGSNTKKPEKNDDKDKKIKLLKDEIKMLKMELDINKAIEFYKTTGIDPQDYMLSICKDQNEDLKQKLKKFVSETEAVVSSDTFENSVNTDAKQSQGEVEVQNLKKENSNLEKELQKIKKDSSNMKSTEEDLKNENSVKSDAQQTQAEMEVKNLTKENSNLKKELQKINEDCTNMKNTEEDLKKKVNDVTMQLQDKIKECKEKTDECNKLRNEIDEIGSGDKQPKTDVSKKIPENNKVSLLEKDKNDLQGQLEKIKEDCAKMKITEEFLRKEVQEVKTKLEEKINECKEQFNECNRMKKKLDERRVVSGKKQSKTGLSSELEENNKQMKLHEKEEHDLQDELKKIKEDYANLISKEAEWKRKIQDLEKEKSELSKQRLTSAQKGRRGNNDQMSEELARAREELSDLKNRLSKVVGAKVMDDNPNITDLSDENRPTKLSEKYSELYDNEWTDAYEEGEKSKKTELEIIQELYKDLTDIHNFCQSLATKHASNIQNSILTVTTEPNQKPTPLKPGIDVTRIRLLKELRKSFAPLLVDSVFELYNISKKIDLKDKPKKEKFAREVTRICWLMASQDPPVVLETKNAKGDFDGDRFRTYTKTGKKVDFVVWPPMLLHKEGPLLSKGVAQGK